MTVDVNDTSNCIDNAKYIVEVLGEEHEITSGNPVTLNVDLPPCVKEDFVLSRRIDGIQIGGTSSLKTPTYQGEMFPQEFDPRYCHHCF